MRTIKRKESSPNYVQRFYLLSFLFIQRHQPFLATLPDLSKETNKILNRRQRSHYFPDVGLLSLLFL